MEDIKTEIIDTTQQIRDLVDWLVLRHAPPVPYSPTMYIDLEGVDLCHEGSISILTLATDTGIPTRRICLINVHTLGIRAFNTAGVKGKTLKDTLEDAKTPKVFFDVRNDCDALFALFGVALHGVEDVQLVESATRTTTASRKFLSSLTECVKQNCCLSIGDRTRTGWKLDKQHGERLFKAEYGGTYNVFNQRPIPKDIVSYCVGDVMHLPEVRSKLWAGTNRWQDLVLEETKRRFAATQEPGYEPHSPNRALAPWTEEQNAILDE